jgi:alpha-L-arabinofuranosidase
VMSMANLAQIVNVLQSTVMTEGSRMWLTPTYHALNLHTPHIGAQALPVTVSQGDNLPSSNSLPSATGAVTSAVTATASRGPQGTAITLINRHYTNEAVVRFDIPGTQATGQLLSAGQANAINTADQPDNVRLVNMPISHDGANGWCVELPPHSMATVIIN